MTAERFLTELWLNDTVVTAEVPQLIIGPKLGSISNSSTSSVNMDTESEEREREYEEDLLEHEHFWVDHQPFLLSRGYQLPPRYDPKWIPSWKLSDELPESECPDNIVNSHDNLLDAVRVTDKSTVVLKKVRTWTDEVPIASYLSSDAMRSDPRNRAPPLLDVVPIPGDDEHCFIVMPLLREFDSPPFSRRNEVIEALRQFLQGIEFMHENNIVHRDACWLNLMMDSSKMIPGGFHPQRPFTEDGVRFKLKWKSRTSVAPVDYYIIDFGLSSWFRDPTVDTRTTGKYGQNRKVPEFQSPDPHDTFKVDIYQLGDVIIELMDTYKGRLEVFRPLALQMTCKDPLQRPTASQALEAFESIVSSLTPAQRNARIRRSKDTLSRRFWLWRIGAPNL